ncbi:MULTISPECIES: phage tail tape measure protein [unclassified Sphingobacterium]|uniref:phage tail tape measure protein n=1 Tax=unclassified Sphingobacterium TaxID=2609468 RepID=UPI0025F7EEA8|nr:MULTISPECIES: phage tail tape measure protein [unclassified Sphingobacterium]
MADLRYKVVLDDTEARKKLRELLSNTGVGSSSNPKEDSKKSTTSVDDVRNATLRLKVAQIANIEAIRQARLEQAKQKQEQSELTTKFKEGQLTMQEFRLEQGKLNAARKEQSRIERELKKNLADNSEYAQLSKALNNVRRETKDLLAEMFKLERQGRSSSASYEMLKRKSEALTKQTQYLDKAIKRIDATVGQHQRNVGNYAQALENMSPIIARLNMNLALMGTSVSELAARGAAGFSTLLSSVKSLGAGLASFLLTPVGAVIALLATLYSLIRAGGSVVIGFNSRLMSVSKTTGLAGAELNKFGDAIVELSRKLQVVSTDKLLEYATVAGQLGVKGRANLLAFAEALAKLETASDIKGEEGGTSIARTLTLVDGGVQNVKDFGDEIVNLGNNFAATEAEILSNAESIAQNTGVYKVGRRDVLAYAVATKAVGLEAEVVGSTFSRTLGEFEKMIRTGKGVADLSKVIGKSSQEISDQFKKDASSVFKDYINGLNRISLSGGSVNEALERTGVIAVRDQRVIATLATNGYATLSDALVKVGEAAGAMDREFETGASKLEQQLNRIGIAWDNFILSIEQGDGVLGKAAVSIANLVANYADYMSKVITPSSFQEWTSRISFNNKEADAIREVTLGYKDAAETFAGLSGFNVSTANYDKLKEKYEEVGSSIQALQVTTEKYKAYVKDGLLTEGGKRKIEDYTKLIQNLSGSMWQIELFMKSKAPQATEKIDFEQSEEERRKAEREAEAARNKAEREAEARRQAMERQRALQLSIDQLNEQSLRGQLSRDEQEVASIRDKYAKIREEVRKFYADPKNKGLRVDTGSLQGNEDFEISEANKRIDTRYLIDNLNQQKSLYEQFEQTKLQIGEEKARERFSKELDLSKTYGQLIEKEMGELASIDTSKRTAAERERLDYLTNEQIAYEKKLRDADLARFIQAMDLAKTHSDKLKEIDNKYQLAFKQLEENKTSITRKEYEERKAILLKGLEEDKKESNRQFIESNSDFKKSMKFIEEAGAFVLPQALKLGRETIKNILNGMQLTSSQRKELEKLLDEPLRKASVEADMGLYDNVANALQGFDQLIESALQLEGSLGKSLKTISNMVLQAGQLSRTLGESLKGEKEYEKLSQILSKVGKVSPLVGTVVGVYSTLTSMFDKAREKRNQDRQEEIEKQNELQLKSTEAITKLLERQLELINDIYGVARIEKYASSLNSIKDNYAEINKQLSGRYLMNYDDFTNDILRRVNNGESAKEIQKSFKTASVEGVKAYEVLKNLSRYAKIDSISDFTKDISKAREELQALQLQADLGKTDDFTRSLIEQLQNQIDLYVNTMNKLREETTGTSFQSLLGDVKNLFLNSGEDAAEAWSKGFDKIMENYLMQRFSREYLEESLQGWYEAFDVMAKDGITSDEKDALKQAWDKINKDGQERLSAIKDAIGFDSNKNENSNSLSGAYARASQESIDLLAGQTGAMRAHLSELIQLQKNTDMTLKQCVDAAQSHLTQLILIERNTRVTADNASNYLPYLKGIESNTKGNLDMQLRAAGKFGF